ncbi:MAG: MATE family efflux transporter [Lachnospiraceae bacterium]|nr:MATE family efflux transporter [Lachnospiraceae bacterium]
MEKSLTEGNSLKQIIGFAFPLLLGNLFQQMYNLADSIIVGKALGINALASVGASSSLNFLILGFCMGLCGGFAIPVAQSFGARDYSAMRRYVMNAAVLSAGIAVVIAAVTAVFCRQILILIRTPENILDGAYLYLVIIFIGIPFTVLYNMAAGILRALGDSKSPFLFLAVSTVLNIAGDLLTILVLGMGVEGAALATITAQAVSGICCVIYMKKKFSILKMGKEECHPSGRKMKTLLGMGVPMGLQFSITAIGSVMMQSAVNSLGSDIVAAFTAGLKVKQFAMAPFDALSNTSATFCGQNLGARKLDRIRKGIGQMILIGFLYSLLASFCMIFLGSHMVRIFVDSTETDVIRYAHQYLRCMGYFFSLLAVLNVVRSAVQGLGHSGSAMLAGLLEMVARTGMSLFVIPVYGFTAACFTDQTAWVAASTYIVIDFLLIMRREQAKSLQPLGR